MITLLTYYYLIRSGALVGGLPDFRKDFGSIKFLAPLPGRVLTFDAKRDMEGESVCQVWLARGLVTFVDLSPN
ncbi:hypothetical protein PIB30_098321, partial [Stylosanthes scabra]|nr:hypothetical protein [Stylosanthes scabra]